MLDSLNYLPLAIRKLSDSFGLTTEKSWYPHIFNTAENMTLLGPTPDISYYVVDQMCESDRK